MVCFDCRYFKRCPSCQDNLTEADLLRYKLAYEDCGGRIASQDFMTLKQAEEHIAKMASHAEDGYEGIVLYEIKELYRGKESAYKGGS